MSNLQTCYHFKLDFQKVEVLLPCAYALCSDVNCRGLLPTPVNWSVCCDAKTYNSSEEPVTCVTPNKLILPAISDPALGLTGT